MKQFFFIVILLYVTSTLSQSLPNILAIEFNIQKIDEEFIDPLILSIESTVILDSVLIQDSALQEGVVVVQQDIDVMSHQDEVDGGLSIIIILESLLDENVLSFDKVYYKIGRVPGGNDIDEGFVSCSNNADCYSVQNQLSFKLGVYSSIRELYGEFYIESTEGNVSPVFIKEFHL